MKLATVEDKALVVDLLAGAFQDNPSVNFIVQQDERRRVRIRVLMAYGFEMCRRFGAVWLSDDNHACALVLYPARKRFGLRMLWLDLGLVFRAVGIRGIGKVLRREALVKERQQRLRRFSGGAYLWFIGVNPLYQRCGRGTLLLLDILAYEQELQRALFLETSVPRNVAWYQHHGFRTYDSLHLDKTLYFLTNSPS